VSEIAVDELAARIDQVAILDVRNAAEYDGSAGCACDPRQGHIPGAVHLPLEKLRTLSEEEIRARVGLEPGAEVVAYCHSGARSAVAAQLLRAAGYDARNYAGSWHEWSRLDLPFVAGAQPD